MMKKKGLEPIIATILLIVVAVILVTIVLAWGKNFSTEGLNKTDDVLNDKCSGAAISISECEIMSDVNIVFELQNIGQTYSFLSTDYFKIMVTSSTGNEAEKNLTYAQPWAGLTPGQTVIAKYAPNQADVNTTAPNANVTIMVRSTICPQATTRASNCHR